MISVFRNTLAGLAVVAACAPAAQAQVNSTNQGYLVDQNFNVVTAVGGTVCVRTSDWTPARAAAGCGGFLRNLRKPSANCPYILALPRTFVTNLCG